MRLVSGTVWAAAAALRAKGKRFRFCVRLKLGVGVALFSHIVPHPCICRWKCAWLLRSPPRVHGPRWWQLWNTTVLGYSTCRCGSRRTVGAPAIQLLIYLLWVVALVLPTLMPAFAGRSIGARVGPVRRQPTLSQPRYQSPVLAVCFASCQDSWRLPRVHLGHDDRSWWTSPYPLQRCEHSTKRLLYISGFCVCFCFITSSEPSARLPPSGAETTRVPVPLPGMTFFHGAWGTVQMPPHIGPLCVMGLYGDRESMAHGSHQ